jgi:hypothetical protein
MCTHFFPHKLSSAKKRTHRFIIYNLPRSISLRDHGLFCMQIDSMLQELEKEIDDVDAQIGNRWQLLDR